MIQSTTTSNDEDAMMSFFARRDLEVAPILLELFHPVIFESKPSPTKKTLKWGSKKKRSIPTGPPPSSSPSPVPTHPVGGAGVASAGVGAAPSPPTNKVVAVDSPVTPLSFSPSESDEKSKDLNKKVSGTKRKREESVEMRDMLSRQNELLKKEIETVNQYYLTHKALNLKLKKGKLELENLTLKRQLALATVKPHTVDCHGDRHYQQYLDRRHQKPFIAAHLTAPLASAEIMSFPYHFSIETLSFQANYCGLGSNSSRDNVGSPLGIDLNVAPAKAFYHVYAPQPLVEPKSEKAIAAAEARQMRREICRAKMASSHKPLSSQTSR